MMQNDACFLSGSILGHSTTTIRSWRLSTRRLCGCIALLLCAILATPEALAGKRDYAQLFVAEPYLELKTGPGRGYPVTQVVARGEAVDVLFRRTDYFKVRTERDGKLRGMIFHMPCMPPQKIFSPDLQVIERVWHRVHEFLDQAGPGLQRIGT